MACPLAHLPPELLPVIFAHSTGLDLARWALTNGDWARAITPALAAFWKTHKRMCDALRDARSFEELEAVPKMSASCTMKSTHDLLSIGSFRLEASFVKLQQQAGCSAGIKDVDASDAAERLDAAKKCLRITPHPWTGDRYGSYFEDKFAIATTLRLRPPELMEVAQSWLAAASGGHQANDWVAHVVGAALGKNLHRTKIDNRKLAELLPLAITNSVSDDGDLPTDAQVVDIVIEWLPDERRQRVARLVRPPNEPENARFWFEFLFCELQHECPMFFLFGRGQGDDEIKRFCEDIDAHTLAKLIEITVEQEAVEFEDAEEQFTVGEIHQLTVELLRGWVVAKNFPAEPLSPEEQTAFIGILTSLDGDIKGLLSREALTWVMSCSRLSAPARLICSALA